MMDYN